MSEMSSQDLAVIESQLKGKTLQIYWYLLRFPNSKVGVRKIQRTLGLSSPSVAVHHLEKLISMGLVRKNAIGEYIVAQEVRVGLLRFFTRLGSFLVPRYLFYSLWFTSMFFVYLALYWPTGSIHNVAAIIFASLASSILWFETVRLWKEKPF